MDKHNGRFIGINRIVGTKLIERKTCLDKPIFELTYKDGSKVELPAHMVDLLMTKKASDPTTLRELMTKYIVKETLTVFLDSEIKIEDINNILDKISQSVKEAVTRATAILYDKAYEDRTMQDVNKILKHDK